MLNVIHHPGPDDLPPVVIAHGLFGSARNWGVIGKRLSDTRNVFAVDMRNHGDSPWFDTHTYPDMANDLAETIASLGAPADVVGHSMGGKAAMALATQHPDLVGRMIVADIAPTTYSHTQLPLIHAMQAVDLSQVSSRSDAAEQLTSVDDPSLRAFLLQSLDLRDRRWKLNLKALGADMDAIIGFPAIAGRFDNPTLFLSGADSDYVRPEHRPDIKRLFPEARFAKIPGAGHWLHAEKPREFEAAVRAFLAL